MKNVYDMKINKVKEAQKELDSFLNEIKANAREYLCGKIIKGFKCIDGDFKDMDIKNDYYIEVKDISENKIKFRLKSIQQFRYCGNYTFEKFIKIEIDDLFTKEIDYKRFIRRFLANQKHTYLYENGDESKKSSTNLNGFSYNIDIISENNSEIEIELSSESFWKRPYCSVEDEGLHVYSKRMNIKKEELI